MGVSVAFLSSCLNAIPTDKTVGIFIRPFEIWDVSWEHRRAASTGFPLSKSKIFLPVFIKLGKYVTWHNISTMFYNQPNSPGTPELWPLNCPKTELAVSAPQVEYPAPKNVVIRINLSQIRQASFVSVWQSYYC